MEKLMDFVVLLFLSDLYYINIQTKGFQENAFVNNSGILRCAGNTTINIIDLNVKQSYTKLCLEYKPCNLTEEQTNAIKTGCNNETACTVSTIIPTSCLFKGYAHVSISYSCKGIVNSSCNFTNDDCGWRVSGNDRYKWTLQRGKTPETFTGPGRDHTTTSAYGYYVYTESLSGSISNDESDLLSGLIVPSPKQCLTFWYHMYGKHINTLKVFQRNSENNRYVELWSKSDNQGNKWYFQSVTLQNIGPYQIIFKAIRGDGNKNEIAVDDIFITNTVCKKASTIDCNFETKCKWASGDTTYKWKLWRGRTLSDDTGPDVDHTVGTKASSIPKGQKLNFTSMTVYPNGNACFTFWYHMFGDGMGTLNVYLDTKEESRIAWSKSGNWKKKWLLASVEISSSEPYNIIFEGIRGSTTKSDIALDDISLLSTSCEEDEPITIPECSKYYLQFSKINLKLDQKFDDCLAIYKDVQASTRTICNNMNNSDICTFNLSEVIRKDSRCFQSNRLLVEYTCEDIRLPNILSDDSQTKKNFLDIGSVVGIVVEIVLLAGIVIKYKQILHSCLKTKQKQKHGHDKNAHVGNQSASLASVTADTNNPNSQCIATQSANRNNIYDNTNFKDDIISSECEYSNIAKANSVINKNETTVAKYGDHECDVLNFDLVSHHDEYAIVNRTTEISFIKEPIHKTASKKSNMVLGHQEKKFEGSEFDKLSKPTSLSKKKHHMKTEHGDDNRSSEEGTYDLAGSNRHKEADGNIYSHTDDNVYDSTTYKRNNDNQEDKYDHFIGQKTEDLYDTSMQT
ncbi:unnamed protein product [Mytilus coruscus]|uniref:MAM domain-containing protein n=1 Tax=Mytilus coruscus TaxID=42192 RepID=A0A6J8C138_MYTCO|nr:unnamed protein product [Mytilus coruscus]